MFFLPDVLLRCMYGRFFGGFVFSDFVYGDRGFSCIDIDIVDSVVVVITVYSIRL